ncbi:MAG: hypothetical protein RLZ13_815, partial [Bacteroidota bacterium]
ESAEKKANADIRRKSPQIDKSSFGRLAYLPKAESLRLGGFARVNFLFKRPPRRKSILIPDGAPLEHVYHFHLLLPINIMLLRSTVKNFHLQIKQEQDKPSLILAPEELAP